MEEQIYTAFQSVWSKMVTKDSDTAKHCLRTAILCGRFGSFLGLDPAVIRELKAGAILHDVGKLKIEKAILTKPGKLSDDEYTQLKQHPLYGIQVLEEQVQYLTFVNPYIRSHHERLDGNGYPDQLHENQIPLSVRVLTLCDSYDCMAYDRIYRHALTKQEIIQELVAHEEQFDPQLVKEFLSFLNISSKSTIE